MRLSQCHTTSQQQIWALGRGTAPGMRSMSSSVNEGHSISSAISEGLWVQLKEYDSRDRAD